MDRGMIVVFLKQLRSTVPQRSRIDESRCCCYEGDSEMQCQWLACNTDV